MITRLILYLLLATLCCAAPAPPPPVQLLRSLAASITATAPKTPINNVARIVRKLRGLSAVARNPKATLKYYGGPVLNRLEVTTLFLGKNPNQSGINAFHAFLVKSPYMDFLSSEYSGPDGKIGYGTLKGSYVETDAKMLAKKAYTDDGIQSYLTTLAKQKRISPNRNSYYPIYLPPGKSVSLQGLVSCENFCGYHGAVNVTKLGIPNTPYLYYAVIPDQTGSCAGGCGMGSAFENLCSVSSHEVAEVVTDAAMSLVTSVDPMQPMAWFAPESDSGGEIADMQVCNTIQEQLTDATGKKWTVQKLWSNANQKCMAQITPSKAKPTTRRV